MAQRIGGGGDTAAVGGALITGAFVAIGQSAALPLYGPFNVSLWGTFAGTTQLERTFDGGTTWLPVDATTLGTVLVWTAPFSGTWTETEKMVPYRLNCTAYTSGTINYRISQASDFIFTGGVY
jgi:hypothetical protein